MESTIVRAPRTIISVRWDVPCAQHATLRCPASSLRGRRRLAKGGESAVRLLQRQVAGKSQIRIHLDAGFDRLRRLHREWPGHHGPTLCRHDAQSLDVGHALNHRCARRRTRMPMSVLRAAPAGDDAAFVAQSNMTIRIFSGRRVICRTAAGIGGHRDHLLDRGAGLRSKSRLCKASLRDPPESAATERRAARHLRDHRAAPGAKSRQQTLSATLLLRPARILLHLLPRFRKASPGKVRNR